MRVRVRARIETKVGKRPCLGSVRECARGGSGEPRPCDQCGAATVRTLRVLNRGWGDEDRGHHGSTTSGQ